MTVPDFVTHYHRADRAPFLSLSDLDDTAAAPVLRGLAEGSARRFGPRYLALRRATEERLRRLFAEAGGRPERDHPHYFVLGESPWFRGLYDDPAEVRLPLAALPDAATSVTYPDSMTAMQLVPGPARPYHGRVFRLADLDALIAEHGLPDPRPPFDYAGYRRREFELYVEVQVWADL